MCLFGGARVTSKIEIMHDLETALNHEVVQYDRYIRYMMHNIFLPYTTLAKDILPNTSHPSCVKGHIMTHT